MRALLMVFLVLAAPLSGCFGNSDSSLTAEDLVIEPGSPGLRDFPGCDFGGRAKHVRVRPLLG